MPRRKRMLRWRLRARPLAETPDAVLVIGLCGGLTESLAEDRIVAYKGCLSKGPIIVSDAMP